MEALTYTSCTSRRGFSFSCLIAARLLMDRGLTNSIPFSLAWAAPGSGHFPGTLRQELQLTRHTGIRDHREVRSDYVLGPARDDSDDDSWGEHAQTLRHALRTLPCLRHVTGSS